METHAKYNLKYDADDTQFFEITPPSKILKDVIAEKVT